MGAQLHGLFGGVGVLARNSLSILTTAVEVWEDPTQGEQGHNFIKAITDRSPDKIPQREPLKQFILLLVTALPTLHKKPPETVPVDTAQLALQNLQDLQLPGAAPAGADPVPGEPEPAGARTAGVL